jgi:hypothetical protein
VAPGAPHSAISDITLSCPAGEPGHGSWREARRVVDQRFGGRLADLAGSDRYRLGDVAGRLLAYAGVGSPVEDWQRPRLAELFSDRHEEILACGLTGVLVRDGVRPVASVRERLLRRCRHDVLGAEAWETVLYEFRVAAAVAREAEIEWMVRELSRNGLCDGGSPRQSTSDELRALFLGLWFGRRDFRSASVRGWVASDC